MMLATFIAEINKQSYYLVALGSNLDANTRPDPEPHPELYTMGTGSFPVVKRPGRGPEHQPRSSPDVKERIELYISLLFIVFYPCNI